MSEPSVLYAVDQGVASITLNRPAVLNALDEALLRQLLESLQQARAGTADGTVRAVLIAGTGRGFCSGGDLQLIGGSLATGLDQGLRDLFHPVILAMRDLPAPIVGAVHGPCAGAGMSVALACDIVLAAKSATFLQAFTKIGLIPDAGSTYFLPRLVGDVRARALTLLAEKIDAEQALRMGLVWQVHDDDALLPAARDLALRMAKMPTRALALTKAALNASLANDLPAQLEMEARSQKEGAQTEDFREGVAAFLGKRPPAFRGR